MRSKLIVGFALMLLVLFGVSHAQDSKRVETLLQGIDTWVTTDTAKILSFIDSSNAITEKMLEASKYWEPTHRDLSFLLGIDYIGTPQIDNTGRIYFMMRINWQLGL